MRMLYKKRDFARQLRQEQTAAEEKVWAVLRDRQCFGLKFRRQHVLEGFVVDFYCLEKRLVVEVDGRIHDRQKDYDELRQREIESKNIKMIRIRNEELKSERVLFGRIKETLELSAE